MRGRFDFGEPKGAVRGLATVFLLSALAGAVDACGLLLLKDLFVSFMSGNTTSLGIALVEWDVPRLRLIGAILALFVLGAAAGTIVATLIGRRHLPFVVAAVAAILAVPVIVPGSTVYAMTVAMGALNETLNRVGAVTVSVTYVTGTLVKVGRGLGRLACGELRNLGFVEQAAPWFGILGGAIVAQVCLRSFGPRTIEALPLVALAIAVVVVFLTITREPAEAPPEART